MLVPARHFPGTCAEAMALYQKALGARILHVSHCRDAPAGSDLPTQDNQDRVMHAEPVIAGTRVNLCDVEEQTAPGSMYLLNLFLDATGQVAGAFRLLAAGGRVFTELGPQLWARCTRMLRTASAYTGS